MLADSQSRNGQVQEGEIMAWKIEIDSDLCIHCLNGMCEEHRNAGKNKWCEEKNCPLKVK